MHGIEGERHEQAPSASQPTQREPSIPTYEYSFHPHAHISLATRRRPKHSAARDARTTPFEYKTETILTVRILTQPRLIKPRPAPIRAALTLLAVVGRVRGEVRRCVGLRSGEAREGEGEGEEGGEHRERRRVKEPERKRRGQREGGDTGREYLYGRSKPSWHGGY